MRKRVFISQPMRGRTQLGIEEERRWITKFAKEFYPNDEVIVIPMLSETQAKLNHPVLNLGLTIQYMSQADVVIFSPDWVRANGCCIEHTVCERYDLHYIELGHTEDSKRVYKVLYESLEKEE